MKKKILSMLIAGVMAISMAGCGGAPAEKTSATPEGGNEVAESNDDTQTANDEQSTENTAEASSEKAESNGKKIGVAMPTQSSERWINDGKNMKEKLEALGYEVDLQYAEDDVQAQVSQLENLLAGGANCLVVAAVDSSALVNVLGQAKSAGIPVIAYDRLLMDTDAVSYYATFDNKGVGTAIANYVVKQADLDNATEPLTFELFMGSPDDNNAWFLYDGIMEVIQPYIDKGTLVCKSGQLEFEKCNTLRWDQQTAMKRCEDILSTYYADEPLDIAFSAFDGLSYGIKAACEGAGYKVGDNWPLITGQDAELMAAKNIISGSQTMSIFKDTRILADKCVLMVQAVMEEKEPEINDTKQYDNNKLVVPSYLCVPEPVDKENYKEILVDSSYYSEEQLTAQ